jgi:GNAT superfamily N-acetyltransferase
VKIIPLEEIDEKRFLDYLDKDRILHVFTIYDLKRMREKTEVWVAIRNGEISGYLFQFDQKIVHTHGDTESVAELLRFVDLEEPTLVIRPRHLAVVEKFFKPVEPTDSSSKGEITRYFVMIAYADTFKPTIKHRVKKLGLEDLDDVSKSPGDEPRERLQDAINRGLASGAYHNRLLASFATVPEILERLALVRGVYTVPSLRRKGLATSACSALVAELIRLGKEPMLWVAKDNLPARRVYEKVGFKKTGHILFGFKARRL